MNQPYIAIEGPIGVGKSSLAHRLSQSLDYHEAQEIVDENPFLSDFYDDISKWSFQTEMFFLCNRYKQVQDLEHLLTVLSVTIMFIKTKSLRVKH